MRILIVGAGRIGMHLISHLSMNEDNKLTVIEKRKDRCKEVSNKYDATIINGDASKPETLKSAETSTSDLLLVATDDDRVNIATVKAGKEEFAVPKIVAVANSPKNKVLLKEAGADVVICPVELALEDFENLLAKERSITLMYRPELDLKVSETMIPMNGSMLGKKIHELKLPEKCRIALITRNDQYVFPDDDVELRSGDRILLLGDAPSVQKTVELLKSSEEA